MRNRRNTELLLLLAGLPVIIVLFAMYLMNTSTDITWSSFAVPLGLFAGFMVVHLVVRKFAPNADPCLLPIVFLLSGIGIIFVMRLAPDLAVKQLLWLWLAIAALMLTVIFMRSIEKLARYKYTIMLAGIVLLLLPSLVGTEIYGSKIWITVAGFSFQPGEIAKILIVVFLASYLAENREMLSVSTHRFGPFKLPDLKTLFPLLLMWGISMVIVIFERDLGSALLFFGITVIMLYTTTGRWFYVVVAIGLLAIGAVGAYYGFSHVRTRVDIWLDPFSYAETSGYQLVQGIYSMADGGLFGTGIGRGLCDQIPVVESDFIFAAIAEEMGLLGAAGVLLLFILFAVRGFLTAARAKSDVAAFTAIGLTVSVSFQAFIIVGGVTRLIPLTGLTLPFMSQGGSSLLASFIIVGLLLRVGDEGTGVETEMTATGATAEGGVLGRYALGKRISQLTILFAVLFALLIANLTYIQVIKADEIKALPTNNHTITRQERNQRGSIITSDGVVLAESVLEDDGTTYTRVYPNTSLAAHLVGYYSTQYGTTGIESSQNEYLTGSSGYASWADAINSLSGSSVRGNDVVLTIDSTVQEVAEAQLEGSTGAIVALDPTTGAVLAYASSPTYDLNDVESALSSSDALYDRVSQALYAPGSSFKMVTLSAALEENLATKDSIYEAPASITIGNGTITNYDNEAYGTISLLRATEVSSNTVYAQVATQLGSTKLVQYANRFGFDNADLGLDFSITASLMPDASEMTEWETAWSGCGQPVGEHTSAAGPQATVIQMALVQAAIANDGVLMHPYVVKDVQNQAGEKVTTTSSAQYGRVISSSTASKVMEVLTADVASGSGSGASVTGATVAGKTGTAETGKAVDDAWFVGVAEAGGKKVVVAVLIEQGGTGGSVAAPKAGQVMEAALKAEGAL